MLLQQDAPCFTGPFWSIGCLAVIACLLTSVQEEYVSNHATLECRQACMLCTERVDAFATGDIMGPAQVEANAPGYLACKLLRCAVRGRGGIAEQGIPAYCT